MIVLIRSSNNRQLNSFSKYLSKLLRHTPEEVELSIDSEGWVSTSELINNLAKFNKYIVDLSILKEIVDSDNKGRYSFKDNYAYIRANQGHSCKSVNLSFKEFKPTGVLYHGTADRALMHGKKVWGYDFLTVVDIRVLYDIYLRINEGPTFINGNVKKALDRMGIKLMQWIRIAPNQDILQGYKSGQLDELDYELKYRLQLQNADVLGDWDKMLEIVGNLKKEYRGIVFLCY